MLCSVVEHLGSAWSTQEGRNTRLRLVFPPTLLWCSSRSLRVLQQNRAQSRYLYLLTSKQPVTLNVRSRGKQFVFTAPSLAYENSRFSKLLTPGHVSRRGTSATQRKKSHTDDVNQCLHYNKSVVVGFQMPIFSILLFSWSIFGKCCVHLRTSSRKSHMLLLEKNIFHKN